MWNLFVWQLINQEAGSSYAAMFWSCDQLADKPLPPAKWRWGRKWNGTTDNDVLINSKIVYWGLVLIKMWLRLSEKNRKHPSFGASSKKMCVFDGKTWTFGRMLGQSVSYLQLEQTLYALWITNNTIVFINLVSSSNTSFSQTIIQQSWYSYPKYNNTNIIWLLTNWSLDCILHNNCRQFSWRHKGDWNCRWIIGFIDRLALWLQFWGNR